VFTLSVEMCNYFAACEGLVVSRF